MLNDDDEQTKLIARFLETNWYEEEDPSTSLSGTNDGHLVFVYGSLKRGFGNHDIIRQSGGVFLGEGKTVNREFDMLSMSAFPACHRKGDFFIAGEVYAVDSDCLASLDMLEGNGHFYTREEVLVEVTQRHGLGQVNFAVPAWMYLVDAPDKSDWYNSNHFRENAKSGILNWRR